MGRQVDVSGDDSRLLREISEAIGLDQKTLSKRADVTRAWLSGLFKVDRNKSVDGEMVERVANILVSGLTAGAGKKTFSEDRVRNALTSLSRFTATATTLAPPKIYRPGGPVPIDALHYIKRLADDEALQALQEPPFTMLVSGAVHSGKSSLLARLEHTARKVGIETAWFDPRLPVTPNSPKSKQQSDITATAATVLSEKLTAEWGLEEPQAGPTDSIPKLFHWLLKELAATAAKPRLLIIDDIASLGPRAVEDWLSLFVRAIDTKRTMAQVELSIAVGLTHHFGHAFNRKLLELSSIVHWWPRIELGWFEQDKVLELERLVTGGTAEADNLFSLFRGQPYLTHAAAADTHFRDAVRQWISSPTEVSARPVRGAKAYGHHMNAIRLAIMGPTWDKGGDIPNLIYDFVRATEEREIPSDPDRKQFLSTARLLNESFEPASPIYKIVADDLKEFLER